MTFRKYGKMRKPQKKFLVSFENAFLQFRNNKTSLLAAKGDATLFVMKKL